MPFLLLLAINIVLNVANAVLQKAIADKQAQAPAPDFVPPTATAGNPIPVFWGVATVAPNTTWWGNLLKHLNKGFWTYYMSAQHLLCWGVVNEIVDISFNQKSLQHLAQTAVDASGIFTGDGMTQLSPGEVVNPGAPLELRIYGDVGGGAESLFGGVGQGGGVGANWKNTDFIMRGQLCMYWGFDDPDSAQPVDGYLNGPYSANASTWPNLAYLRMGSLAGDPFYIAAGGGTPAQMNLILRRTAWWDTKNTGALSPLGQTPEQATIRYDANAAEILYDLLTHRGYGLGVDPSTLDLDSFTACAIALRDEPIVGDKVGFGISVSLTQPTDAASVITAILDTIDGSLCTNPVTGTLRLKLIRADYDLDELPILDETNTSQVQFAPSTWADTINEVSLTYNRFVAIYDPASSDPGNRIFGFVDDVAIDQDLANFDATGRVRPLPLNLPYITDPDVAQLVAARKRRQQSVPLARFSCKMNRRGFNLMQGDPVLGSERAFGVTDMVLRVQTIDYGTLESGEVTVALMQDVFSVTQAVYRSPAPDGAPPTSTDTDGSGDDSTPAGVGAATWGIHF